MFGLVALGWFIGFAFGLLLSDTQAADLSSLDGESLALPTVGACGLRVLSPTLLELTLITTKSSATARVSDWDFVNDSFQCRAPGADNFEVSAGGNPKTVARVGFKRRPLYAPLRHRDLRIASCLYLELASPVGESDLVEVKNPNGALWPATSRFQAAADPLRWSPAIHVNEAGYLPTLPKKAMVGYYAGDLGELKVPTPSFQVVDKSGHVVHQGALTPRKDEGYTYTPKPYQQVWQADFSTLVTPGEYRLIVPGLGSSLSFRVDEGVAATFARTYALGVFHQRCGMKEELPFTRFTHDACHTGLAQVPTESFTAVNRELANMTSDSATFQTAPALNDVRSSLYPFMDVAPRDVSGGHHDAGDYSKYTINSAGFIHYLVLAADAFPGVANLDNLGLPESGDGVSDILQEAKWEADFLAKMQDADGGFYFLVYPRDREYEDDVLPDKGDPQVVFPKTTAVTAAAVAALAEAGSSPLFKRLFPAESALYLSKARLGWGFLQDALNVHGKAGSYQKITHYGNEFTHDDELAWAAAALFVATGEASFHAQLKAWYDPSDPKTWRWSWWRLFEGYGCAARTYAFAARSGRLSASLLDATYLAKCEAEIRGAADDQVRYAKENAYGTSFPDLNKAYRTAGWYFSSERAFDLTVAYQLNPSPDYVDAVLSNVNYEGGCNPLNVSFITGLGSRRQREIVHQYAENDRRVLPPSGLPLGNVQASFQYLDTYQSELEGVCYPADAATTAPYPYYDRWGDSFNTTTEFVITDQARSLASLSFWMAQTPLQTQAWTSAMGIVSGLPTAAPAKTPVTTTLTVPGLDLTRAKVVWEARDQEPQFGNPVTFTPKSEGVQWVEAEAQLPDGRRVFVATNFLATTALETLPNSFQAAPTVVTSDTVALYHLDTDLADATGQHAALTLSGAASLDSSNLGWMANRQGSALHFSDLGDAATLVLPSRDLRAGLETSAIVLEAMVYVDEFVAYNRDSAAIVALSQAWNAFLSFGEDKYAGPFLAGGMQFDFAGPSLLNALTPKQWHHLALELNRAGYVARLDGTAVASASSDELVNWGNGSDAHLVLGNFSGWIDEIVVRSVRSGTLPNSAPSVRLLEPTTGSSFVTPVNISLAATAADVDGGIAKVEFFTGTTKLGEAGMGVYPYNFVWNGVTPGIYTVTAKATDNDGASTVSAPVMITVHEPEAAATAPSIVPNGGTFENSVSVALSCATDGAILRYTTDGSSPTSSSPVYSEALVLSSSTTVKAKAFRSGLAESPTATSTFLVTKVGRSGAAATFLSNDHLTQGNWRTHFGTDGYLVLGDSKHPPTYAQYTSSGTAEYAWAASASDPRALQKASGNDRVADCWYSRTAFTLDLDLRDGQPHRVSIYAVDWDQQGRAQSIDVLDADDEALLDRQTLSTFADGQYFSWDLRGHVKLRITRLSGPNALLMGMFFDPAAGASDNLGPNTLRLSWVAPSEGIKGTGPRLHAHGLPGQQFVLESSRDLRNWSQIGTNTLVSADIDLASGVGAGDGNRFYRARLVSSPQGQYLIEASSDLVSWKPIALSRSTNNLAAFRQTDPGAFPNRFYRATPFVPAKE